MRLFRSIHAKILLWSLVTFAASLGVFAIISYQLAFRGVDGPGDFFFRTLMMIEDDACASYEAGGPEALASTLRKFDRYYSARHFLTDPGGRDLLDGTDRSSWIEGSTRRPRPIAGLGGWHVLTRLPRDGRYRFLILVHPRVDPLGVLSYFAGIVVTIALLAYALAAHLASPLRSLRQVVDRFGRGDLTARAYSRRRDEIGELSRAFDAMAGQIAALRQAERRLLLDVSHELRSPLARLGFNLELARCGDDPAAAFERIARDLARLSRLIDELLQLTVADVDNEPDPLGRDGQVVRLDAMLGSLVEDCAVESDARDCTIDLRVDAATVTLGDPELIRRAVENVLRNAIRHAPAGSSIEVELLRHGDESTILLRDHGPGVPGSALEAIFEPFFRVEGDRSRSSGGVGLGLAIARRSIERHRGRITARNLAPGLEVAITLPTIRHVEVPAVR